ncbi:hypothetical protein VTK56DRAFT_5617 [Thermocarpiscus australiensis]
MPGRTNFNVEAESSRKRAWHATNGESDDEEVEDVQQARSHLQSESQRKRVRLSDTDHVKDRRSRRDSTPPSSDDDTPEAEKEPSLPPATPPKTQYELMRDKNFEHLRHEAADDQRATQRLRFRPNRLGENAVADNGIIESVTCVNFMCHQRLHCELGPLLNFIVGENGSGKSAILTAITLCLGGKASSTNRGGSLKSFVKEGCDRAVITVKIKNQGQDAYKPDIFGESVIVERFFSRSGANSGYKVKTALGQVYSTKKQEVEELVEYYALQVDNPLNILSQDNARQFLNSSTKAQKYKFFIEGVQLQQLDNDYRLISESLEQMVAKVPDQEELVKHAKAELDKANRLKEDLEGTRKIRVKLRDLRNQMAWAQVVALERELSRKERDLQDVSIKAAEAEREIQEKSQALLVSDEKAERAQEHLRLVKDEEDEIQRRVEDADDIYKRLRKEVEELHVEEREAHQALKARVDRIKELEKKIAEEQKRLEDANGGAHVIKLQERDESKEKEKEIEQAIQDAKDREKELINKLDDSKKALETVGDDVQRKRDEITNVETAIERLEQNRGSPYDGYEPQVPTLLKMIADEKGFENKPVGPLGTHIQLLKTEWSGILEKTIGVNLNAFLVTSRRDEKILRGLMNRAGVRSCPVLICGQHPLDLNGKEPDPEYDTILRVLKFDNQMVRDQLIINHMIEQVILIRDRVRAQNVMFDGAPPRNVKACLSFHDSKRGEGLRLVNNNGNISTSPIQPNPNLRPRMKTDSGSQAALLKESLQQIVAEYRVIDAEKRRLQQETHRCQTALAQLKKDRNSLDSQLRNQRANTDRIESELDTFEGNDVRLQGFRAALEEVKAEQEHHGFQYGTLSAKKQDKNAEVQEAKKKLKEEKLQLTDFEERLRKAEAKLKQANDLRHICLVEKNEAIARAQELAEAKATIEAKVERRKANVEGMAAEAKKVSEKRPTIPEGETYQSIEKQYYTLLQRLDRDERKRGMNEQQVYEYVARTKKVYDEVSAALESSKQVNEAIRQTLNLRLEKWRKFQRYISSQSRANFIYLLSERGFRGKLLLDHERKALDLVVEPDRAEKRAGGRSTKTLSGGEKSFSSICLLLAIWEAMGSPLRCLDEFDVFMDNVNRAISTNMLITAARRSVNRQYIFITPNAIEGRNTLDRDVKIIRLTDPRQRTLADH